MIRLVNLGDNSEAHILSKDVQNASLVNVWVDFVDARAHIIRFHFQTWLFEKNSKKK